MKRTGLTKRKLMIICLIGLIALSLLSCGKKKEEKPKTETEQQIKKEEIISVVNETYLTKRDETHNVDSPAIWYGPNGEHWLLATAKGTDLILIYDATTGDSLNYFGESGKELGKLNYPNGIAVIDDLMFIVERDNHRVQVFTLPELESIGAIGVNDLIRPYGLTIFATQPDQYSLYVTDQYELENEEVPPMNELDKRVYNYTLAVSNGKLETTLIKTFGDTTEPGALKEVESIIADTTHNRLMIADEFENNIKVYTLEGKFTKKVIGDGLFRADPEGIALYSCDDGAGYWIFTDQDHKEPGKENIFYVYDRKNLNRLGAFTGKVTENTDGVALTQFRFGDFPNGAFFPIHDDGNVAAISWKVIAAKLNLTNDCTISTEK